MSTHSVFETMFGNSNRIFLGVVTFISSLFSYAQSTDVTSKKDSVFVRHIPIQNNEEINTFSADHNKDYKQKIMLVNSDKDYVFPGNVKIKLIQGKKKVTGMVKDGEFEFQRNSVIQNSDRVKVVVSAFKLGDKKYKRSVTYLDKWQARMLGIPIPVGRPKNFLGLKRDCPKL